MFKFVFLKDIFNSTKPNRKGLTCHRSPNYWHYVTETEILNYCNYCFINITTKENYLTLAYKYAPKNNLFQFTLSYAGSKHEAYLRNKRGFFKLL